MKKILILLGIIASTVASASDKTWTIYMHEANMTTYQQSSEGGSGTCYTRAIAADNNKGIGFEVTCKAGGKTYVDINNSSMGGYPVAPFRIVASNPKVGGSYISVIKNNSTAKRGTSVYSGCTEEHGALSCDNAAGLPFANSSPNDSGYSSEKIQPVYIDVTQDYSVPPENENPNVKLEKL